MGRVTGRELFRQRALREAERYGPDPYVFVRELAQNARDAGASRIRIDVAARDGACRVSVEDDGEGMSRAHADRFLFVLYASSKGADRRQAGRFGVGFWSVLKIGPTTVEVASRTEAGEAWGIRFDGELAGVEELPGPGARGTRVTLVLGADAPPVPEVARAVAEAARRDARYLTRSGSPLQALVLEVDGVAVNEPLELPAPSVAFRRGRVRGVVGLAPDAEVELHARGLRVRSASTLGELLDPRGDPAAAGALAALPGRLLPRVVVCCDDLDVLLARGDVREDAALRRVVAMASGELDRLVRRQARRSSGAGILDRALDGLRDGLWRRRRPVAALAAIAAVLLLTVALARTWPPGSTGTALPVAGLAVGAVAWPSSRPYQDLATRYAGPFADAAAGPELGFDVQYWPVHETPLLSALRVTDLDGERSWSNLPRESFVPHVGTPCEERCLSVLVHADAEAGPLRLPVPTGHVLDPGSVRLRPPRPGPLLQSPEGQPCLWLSAPFAGTVTYVTGPGPSSIPPLPDPAPALPPYVEALLPGGGLARSLPPEERTRRVLELARRTLRYDRSPDVTRRHRDAAGRTLLERAFAIGAGDCDVVNGALVQMLQSSGIPARLAVGFVGRGGRVVPGLHAWAEVPGTDGWRALDVTTVREERLATDDPEPLSDASSLPAPELAGDLVAPAVEAASPPLPATGGIGLFAFAFLAVASVGGTAVAFAPRITLTRRDVLDAPVSVAALLSGILERPDAFGAGSLARRPLIPLLGGRRRISLERARDAARRGRLAVSCTGAGAGAIAAFRGALVVDGALPEGAVVAAALGAVDLDLWLDEEPAAEHAELVSRVTRAMVRSGIGWRLRIGDGDELSVRDGRPFRLEARLLSIGAADPVVALALRLVRSRPESAVLLVLERLCAAGALPGDGRALVAEQAWHVLREEAGR